MKKAVILLTIFLTACTVGPNYRRPVIQIPDTFRAPAALPPAKSCSA